MDTVEIVATGYAYPSMTVTHDDFIRLARFPLPPEADELGITTRYWCAPDENTWTMARTAVRMALSQHGGLSGSDIDVVLVSSCSTIPMVSYPDPENPIVADIAPLILADIGNDAAVGLDIKAAYCTGFLRGLELMRGLLLSNPVYRRGLLVASDQGGRFATAESNRSAFCYAVGDAAGAVVLARSSTGLIDFCGRTIPSLAALTHWGADGRSLVVRGAKATQACHDLMVECASTLLKRHQLSPADIDWLLPMQTTKPAINALCLALGWPQSKLLWDGGRTGYAASASIAATLAEQIHQGRIRKGNLILSLAVGAGMNSAGTLFRY